MKRLLFSFTVFVFISTLTVSVPAQCGVKCGSERWALKSLSDVDVDEVDFDAIDKSVHWLRTRQRPKKLPANGGL